VYDRGDEVIIERAGKPMAVVIPSAQYEAFELSKQRARDRVMDLIRKNWAKNKDVPPEIIERDIELAIREVRAERRTQEANRKAG
jgi:antitoxin (DNA-binding transcriptional repressor) of toxin-antitoxin stability system